MDDQQASSEVASVQETAPADAEPTPEPVPPEQVIAPDSTEPVNEQTQANPEPIEAEAEPVWNDPNVAETSPTTGEEPNDHATPAVTSEVSDPPERPRQEFRP